MEHRTHANKMHQSSQPTLFTIHIRVANRSVTSTVIQKVVRMAVTRISVELFLSPKGGAVLGCETMIDFAECRMEKR